LQIGKGRLGYRHSVVGNGLKIIVAFDGQPKENNGFEVVYLAHDRNNLSRLFACLNHLQWFPMPSWLSHMGLTPFWVCTFL
jgi:hypothetical protein